ncbi:uncharacterized protein [Ptychodera flava]
MSDIIDKGYAERVPTDDEPQTDGQRWYIPHHGVYHPKKPGKIRVVFDRSAEYHRETLNSHLLQGPDLTNELIGVLCHFRQEPIAFTCDIEAMFHQVGVDVKHRDYLRFLWYENGNLDNEPTEYRLFGATSSPGCVNFALKTTADLYEKDYGKDAADFVRRDFYVYEGLKSVREPSEAINLIESSRQLCQRGGLNCTSTYRTTRKSSIVFLQHNELRTYKPSTFVARTYQSSACWVCNGVESDTFQFRVQLKDKPLTRRGILSTVSSVYDPLGLVSPLLLGGRHILQELCKDGADWDDPIPENTMIKWEKWRRDILLLSSLKIPRCYKPNNFG